MNKSKRGFTLVELLVVMVIVAIIIGAAVPIVIGYVDKSKVKTATTEINGFFRAFDMAIADFADEDYTAEQLESAVHRGNHAPEFLRKVIITVTGNKAVMEVTAVEGIDISKIAAADKKHTSYYKTPIPPTVCKDSKLVFTYAGGKWTLLK